MSLPRLDRIDRFGHCCLCTKNLITQKVADGKVQEMFLPEYGHTFFLLENGSQMQVTICKPCQSQYELTNPEVHKEIMDAVIKGWQLEEKVHSSPNISSNDASGYVKMFNRESIDIHIGSIDKNFLLERSQVLSKNFHERLNNRRTIKNSEEVSILEVSDVIN